MRCVLPLLLALCVAPLSGCFVLDELDNGMDIMEAHTPADKKKPKEAEAPADGQAPTPTGDAWWANAKSLSAEDAEAAPPGDPKQVVSCRIGSNTRFMRRGDCVTQGGTPKG